MRCLITLMTLIIFGQCSMVAQLVEINDNMETYTLGDPIDSDWWSHGNCSGGMGCDLFPSTVFFRSGSKSGLVPGDGTTDVALNLGNKIFDEWALSFWIYIPSNKEAHLQIMDQYPVTSGVSVMGNILFNPNLSNPGEGVIEDCYGGPVNFNFPHDQWFQFILIVEIFSGISLATCAILIDNVEVLPYGTPFTDSVGTTASSFGGIEFLSISQNNELFVDDICYQSAFYENVDEFPGLLFQIQPNPVVHTLNIQSDFEIEVVRIFDTLGRDVGSFRGTALDISSFAAGLYFVEVVSGKRRAVQKFIKN